MSCCCNKDSGNASESVHVSAKNNLPVRCCVALLRGYKRYISPFFPPSCRFTPTCSEYAIDAVRSRGFFYGLFLAVFRLLRCHPFAKGGYDPVD